MCTNMKTPTLIVILVRCSPPSTEGTRSGLEVQAEWNKRKHSSLAQKFLLVVVSKATKHRDRGSGSNPGSGENFFLFKLATCVLIKLFLITHNKQHF